MMHNLLWLCLLFLLFIDNGICSPRHRQKTWESNLPLYNEPQLLYDGSPASHHYGLRRKKEINLNDFAHEVRWPNNLIGVPSWPEWKDSTVRQVTGLGTNTRGDVVVFHRGTREWGVRSFDRTHKFRGHGPIKQNSIVILTNSTGTKISSFGANIFFLPHGLTVDHEDNIWTTDVGLHQVMKFKPGETKPSMVLGTRLVPGNDKAHFCKPTDVEVASNGDFFVADGYCNSRVVKFASNGTVLSYIGETSQLKVVHSIALVEQLDRLYVADRENRRILCFKAGLKSEDEAGEFVSSFANRRLGRIFALKYDPFMNVLYVVSQLMGRGLGSTIDLLNGEVIANWPTAHYPRDASLPHDIAIAPNGQAVYVADIRQERNPLFKLQY